MTGIRDFEDRYLNKKEEPLDFNYYGGNDWDYNELLLMKKDIIWILEELYILTAGFKYISEEQYNKIKETAVTIYNVLINTEKEGDTDNPGDDFAERLEFFFPFLADGR